MPWRYEVESGGKVVGELELADSRTVTPYPIKSLPTATATVRVDNPMVPYLALADRTRLKVYDDLERLLFRGPITSFEKIVKAGQKSVAVTATGIGWKLGYRTIPDSRTQKGYTNGTAVAPKDRTTLVADVVTAIQAIRDEGIVLGTLTPTGSSTYIGPWWDKYGLDAIVELCAPLDGPDWLITPIEDADGGIGRLDVSPAIGQDRANALWEFGTGRLNVASWTHKIDPGRLANRARHLPPGWPDTTNTPVEYWDNDSIAERGLFETTVTADLSVPDLRNKLVAAHVNLRKVPRQVITFEPTAEQIAELTYRVDYSEGDLVRFHALERYPVRSSAGSVVGYSEVDTVDIVTRLRAVTWTLDRNGKATPSFTLLDES